MHPAHGVLHGLRLEIALRAPVVHHSAHVAIHHGHVLPAEPLQDLQNEVAHLVVRSHDPREQRELARVVERTDERAGTDYRHAPALRVQGHVTDRLRAHGTDEHVHVLLVVQICGCDVCVYWGALGISEQQPDGVVFPQSRLSVQDLQRHFERRPRFVDHPKISPVERHDHPYVDHLRLVRSCSQTDRHADYPRADLPSSH